MVDPQTESLSMSSVPAFECCITLTPAYDYLRQAYGDIEVVRKTSGVWQIILRTGGIHTAGVDFTSTYLSSKAQYPVYIIDEVLNSQRCNDEKQLNGVLKSLLQRH